ncbi:MAG: hypothetical protein M3N53_02920 [Actinomycetota bacterium]|nr:hypothetical protein [Actinomycetota bacterium]
MRRIVPIVAVVASVAACGGADSAVPNRCPLPQPLADLSLLPRDVPLDEWGIVDQVEVQGGFVGARAVSETKIVELYPMMARATVDAGYSILSGDNEGFEAEIFFERGKGTTGTYRLREGPCAGQVTIKLLYESERYRRLDQRD